MLKTLSRDRHAVQNKGPRDWRGKVVPAPSKLTEKDVSNRRTIGVQIEGDGYPQLRNPLILPRTVMDLPGKCKVWAQRVEWIFLFLCLML